MIPLSNHVHTDVGRITLADYSQLWGSGLKYPGLMHNMMCIEVATQKSTFKQRLALALGAKQNQRQPKVWEVSA